MFSRLLSKINIEIFVVGKLFTSCGSIITYLDGKLPLSLGKRERSAVKAVGGALAYRFCGKAFVDQIFRVENFLFAAADPFGFAQQERASLDGASSFLQPNLVAYCRAGMISGEKTTVHPSVFFSVTGDFSAEGIDFWCHVKFQNEAAFSFLQREENKQCLLDR